MAKEDRHFNFTKSAIEALPDADPGKRVRYYDTRTRALTLVIRGRGSRSFFVYRRVKGKPEEIYLGQFPEMSVELARREAEKHNGRIAEGDNPNDERRAARAELTFGELFEIYLEQHAKPHKRSWEADIDLHRLHLAHWDGAKLSDITRTDVRTTHARIGQKHPYRANRVLALARKVFNFAIADELFAGQNPFTRIPRFPEKSRERRLHADEMPPFFAALDAEESETIRDFYYMALWTGARRMNVLAMRWEDVFVDRGVWVIPMTKNGTSQTLPLVPEAIAILKRRQAAASGPWVFPSSGETGHLIEPKSSWRRILKRAGIQDLRLHDLRRTLGSWQVDTGASLAIVGKTLNHKSQQTTTVYARLSMDPVRAAMAKATEAMVAAARQKKGDEAASHGGTAKGRTFRLAGGRLGRLVRALGG